jgi:uncharacterized protein YkwD
MPFYRASTLVLARLRLRGFVAVLALGAVVATLATPGAARAAARPSYLSPMEWGVLRNINWVRTHFRLRRLRPDASLTRAADAHTRDMAHRFYYAHDSFNGRHWYSRIRHYVHAKTVAEALNYIYGPRSHGVEPGAVVRSWMASPEHRPILLSRSLRRIGIARRSKHRPGRPVFYTADFASLH